METGSQENFFEVKSKLIMQVLDDLFPMTDDMTADYAESVDIIRQNFVIDSDMGSMTISELQHMIIEHTYSLPTYQQSSD